MTRWSDDPISDKLIDLRCQDEIRFSQPIHCVRPGSDLDFAPSQQNIGMMALFLGQCASTIYEG